MENRSLFSGWWDIPDGKARNISCRAMEYMLDVAVYEGWNGNGNPVWDIVAYETGMYFEENCTLEETVDKMRNRVQTWLNEQ